MEMQKGDKDETIPVEIASPFSLPLVVLNRKLRKRELGKQKYLRRVFLINVISVR